MLTKYKDAYETCKYSSNGAQRAFSFVFPLTPAVIVGLLVLFAIQFIAPLMGLVTKLVVATGLNAFLVLGLIFLIITIIFTLIFWAILRR